MSPWQGDSFPAGLCGLLRQADHSTSSPESCFSETIVCPVKEELLSRAAINMVNLAAVLMRHFGVKAGCGAGALGCLNQGQGQNGPRPLCFLPILGRLKTTSVVLLLPVCAGDHQALCILQAVNVRPSWFLKGKAKTKVFGLLKSVTERLELKGGTNMETIVFRKTKHVSSVNFAALADKMLQPRDHHPSLFKGTNKIVT